MRLIIEPNYEQLSDWESFNFQFPIFNFQLKKT